MLIVFDLDGCIDSQYHRHLLAPAVLAMNDQANILARLNLTLQTSQVESFAALQPQGLCARTLFELAG